MKIDPISEEHYWIHFPSLCREEPTMIAQYYLDPASTMGLWRVIGSSRFFTHFETIQIISHIPIPKLETS